MDWIAIGVIVVYLVGVSVAGSLVARRNRNASDWAVAGGGMGAFMLAVGVAGTRIGGAATYGVAGDVMEGGAWSMWWYGISTLLALWLVGAFFAVSFRRLELHTVGEIFQKRFGTNRCQRMTSLCVQTEYVIVNLIEAYVISTILIGLIPSMPMGLAAAIAGASLIVYVVIGGLWGTAVTNLIHCAVIVFGLLSVVLLGARKLGGWESIRQSVDAHLAGASQDPVVWWSFIGAGFVPAVGMVLSAAIHTPAASVYTNYAASAKNERVAVRGFLIAGVLGAAMPILAGLIGIETLAYYGMERGFGSYKNLTMFATEISPYIGGVALAAVLAAVVSSGGPILLSCATMFVRDWMPASKTYSDTERLRAYRIATIGFGVIGAVSAWLWKTFPPPITILDLLLFGFAMVVPPAIAVGYLIYWRKTTEAGAYWGIVSGYAAGLVWYVLIRYAVAVEFTATAGDPLWHRAFHYCFFHTGEGIDPSYLTTIVPLLVVPLVSFRTQKPETDRDRAFYACIAGKGPLAAT